MLFQEHSFRILVPARSSTQFRVGDNLYPTSIHFQVAYRGGFVARVAREAFG